MFYTQMCLLFPTNLALMPRIRLSMFSLHVKLQLVFNTIPVTNLALEFFTMTGSMFSKRFLIEEPFPAGIKKHCIILFIKNGQVEIVQMLRNHKDCIETSLN